MSTKQRRERRSGQALVEFAISLIPFLFLMMGVFDLGRGIYINNGVAEAAREIARVTSTHPCVDVTNCTIGTSAETAAVIATQKGLVPGLAGASASITITCTTITNATVTGNCGPGDFVSVRVTVPFSAITPLLSMVVPSNLSSISHIQLA